MSDYITSTGSASPYTEINTAEAKVKSWPKQIELPEIGNQPTFSWDERAIIVLNSAEDWLVAKMPNSHFQNRLDAMGTLIEKKLGKLDGFNKWLDDTGKGPWLPRLACLLAKMPLRIARNVVRLLYNAIKCIGYAAVHPVQALVKLAKIGVLLAKALTKSETWITMGSGMMGAGIGNFCVTLNPYALALAGFGFFAVVIGFGIAKLHESRKLSMEDVKNGLDAFFTGFITGATFGATYSPKYTSEDFIKWYNGGEEGTTEGIHFNADGNLIYRDEHYHFWYIEDTQEWMERYENALCLRDLTSTQAVASLCK